MHDHREGKAQISFELNSLPLAQQQDMGLVLGMVPARYVDYCGCDTGKGASNWLQELLDGLGRSLTGQGVGAWLRASLPDGRLGL